MFPTFVTILPLTIPADYRLSSQFLLVGLKVGVRVWLMQKYLFATVLNVLCMANIYVAFNVTMELRIR
jgi:hypothetical protein